MNRLPAVLAAAIVVLAPLPFGSSHAWSASALEVAVFLLLGLLIAGQGAIRVRSKAAVPESAAGLLLAYLCLQLVPLPAPVLAVVGPRNAALYGELLGDTARWLPLSLDPHASLLSLTRLVAYAGIFVICATAPLPRRGNLFYWALLTAGAVTATVAWIHRYRGWETMLFGRFPPLQGASAGGRLSWPFVNPNHLATAMDLCWPLAFGALIAPTILVTRESKWRAAATRIVATIFLVLFVATLAGTKSKGGLAAAIAAPVAMALAWPLRRAVGAPVRIATVGVALSALVAGAFVITLDVVQHPAAGVETIALARSDATLRVRLIAVAQSLLMLRDFPIFGTGLGTWSDAFPMYQRYPLLAVGFSHVHDDYVQWIEETGIAGSALLGTLSVIYFAAILRPLGVDASRKRAALLGALAAAATQSVVDFGVRIPANALMLSAILGLLWREAAAVYLVVPAEHRLLPDRGLAVVSGLAFLGLLVLLGSTEWRDARTFERAEQGVLGPGDSNDWAVLEHAAWKMPHQGLPDFSLSAAAVAASPVTAAAHRTLAYSYRSVAMRELELRRAVRCAPAFQNLRIELARLLLATGRRQAALTEVERTFYENPSAAVSDVSRYLGVPPGDGEFRAAVHAGLERRGRESNPEKEQQPRAALD